MAQAVARAISARRHLVVQAGTGTGKSLAYLVPAMLARKRVVVATATKALQDQLAKKDLPFLARLEPEGSFTFAVLKGRSNYLCRQRAAESGFADETAAVQMIQTRAESRLERQVRNIVEWSESSATGDRSELDFEPDPRAWAAVSVGPRECPGAFRCPSGSTCFAEQARERAAAADVVVVNTHLYATHVASGGAVLPDHDVVIFDEAHEVEDVMTAGLGVELTSGRIRALALSCRGLVDRDDTAAVDALTDSADLLDASLGSLVGRRVLTARRTDEEPGGPDAGTAPVFESEDADGFTRSPPGLSVEFPVFDDIPRRELAGMHRPPAAATRAPTSGDDLSPVLSVMDGRLQAVTQALRRADRPGRSAGGPDDQSRRQRALQAASHLTSDLRQLVAADADHVSWVESSGAGGRLVALRLAPIDVGPLLAEQLWPNVTAVLTSATIPPLAERRLGLPADRTDRTDVGSPFPYARQAMLYCATHLPDRRSPAAEEAIADELATLVRAAGGRTLALFTSWRAMHATFERLRNVLEFPLFSQGDLPKPKLIEAFSADEAACLFATVSFWQGVDIPGPTLTLVTVDRLPFSRPDDPLVQARRDRAGDRAFSLVDVPRAATLLAQGAGRLIRSAHDTGVVAVLDRRLATAGYGSVLRSALPPMRWTTDRGVVVDFLERATAPHGPRPGG